MSSRLSTPASLSLRERESIVLIRIFLINFYMDKIPQQGGKVPEVEIIKREGGRDSYYREGDRPVDTLRRHVVSMRKIFEDPNYGYGSGVLAKSNSEFMNLLNRLEDELLKLESAQS